MEQDFMKFVNENDPVLHTPSHPIIFDDNNTDYLDNIIEHMIELMKKQQGVGLAAPQVGLNLRIFVMYIDDELFECINPSIIESDNKLVTDIEGCLSFPFLRLKITRSEKIYVKYFQRNGNMTTRWLDDLASRCFQHELDHLDGITFDSKVSKLSLKMASEKRRKLLTKITRRTHE